MKDNILKKISYELQFKNTQYYKRVKDKVLKTHYQRVLKKRLLSLPPLATAKEGAPLTLAILANKRNFYESVAAIYSFGFWNKNIYINYHEDGTLTEHDISVLKNIFPNINIFKRVTQDQIIGEYLINEGFHNSAHLRNNFVLSLKLIDTVFNKKSKYLLLIDSDVLFFSRPNEILDIVENGTFNGCYNKDVTDAYCFSIEMMDKYLPAPIVSRFNSGVFLYNFDVDFFHFVESILKNEKMSSIPWHIEQTLFAMYVTKVGNYKDLPETYDVCRIERSLGNKIISEHYTHNTGFDIHKDFIYKIYPQIINKNHR
ncbi:MAG TPA: hypothetical protein VGN20_09080 [Mucilaginibacter sp.]|jgi:hypothetical protein